MAEENVTTPVSATTSAAPAQPKKKHIVKIGRAHV